MVSHQMIRGNLNLTQIVDATLLRKEKRKQMNICDLTLYFNLTFKNGFVKRRGGREDFDERNVCTRQTKIAGTKGLFLS